MCRIGPIRANPENALTALKPIQLHDALTSMTMNDRIDRRRPVPGRDIVAEKRELEAAATKKPPRLKSRGKGETAT